MNHGEPSVVKKTTLYQRTRIGKIQQWSIWVEHADTTVSGHPEVWIEHGQVDGKKQLTHDIIAQGVNVGKANETTPLEQAILTLDRRVIKQREKGYTEKIEALEDRKVELTLPFPKELCFYKPKNSVDDKKIAKLEASKSAIYTVKRDGMMHVVGRNNYKTEIYSRRMDEVSDKYPHLMRAFHNLPYNTILLGEMVLITEDGKDDFNSVSRICRSDSDKAVERQEELGKLKYYIFDIAQYNGEYLLTTKPYSERLNIINHLVNDELKSEYVLAPEVIKKPHAESLKEVQKRGLEGLVVWDANGKMKDDEAYTMNGKAYRPNVLWKSKPKYEDDFIVRFDPDNGIGEYGKGKNNNKLKSVFCYQLDDEGNEVYLGKCGGGLSDEQRTFYTEEATYPRVWRIEYDSIQAKTGSLRFPVFNADRTLSNDKNIEECLMSDKIRQARRE